MTDFKTLKDFETGLCDFHGHASMEDLKEEAIKIVKNRLDRLKELEKDATFPESAMWVTQNHAVIQMFTWFFNITEDDLNG